MRKTLVLLLVVAMLLAGCAATATPAPTAVPAKPTQAPTAVPAAPTAAPAAPTAAPKPAAPTPTVAAKLQPLIVTSGGVNIGHAPLYVGMEKGIFQKYGLDVQLKKVASGFEALSAVQTGDAQVADAVAAVVAQAAQQGVEVRAVLMANGDPTGTKQTDMYFAIVARKESGLKAGDIAGLKGKKVGAPKGTVAHQYLHYALQSKGLDSTKDIELVNVAAADLPSALQSGSVDAIACWETVPLQALSMVKDSVEVTRGGNVIEYLFMRWMSPTFIKNNPAAAKAFVAAWAESAQYTRKNLDESVDIVAKSFPGVDKAVIKKAVSYLSFDLRYSKSTQASIQQGLDFAKAVGALKGDYDFSKSVDLSLLDQVMKERPELFSDLPAIPANLAAK